MFHWCFVIWIYIKISYLIVICMPMIMRGPGSSWAYVQVQRSDISNTVGYVLVDAIK